MVISYKGSVERVSQPKLHQTNVHAATAWMRPLALQICQVKIIALLRHSKHPVNVVANGIGRRDVVMI
jgi:hypothetical protein